MGGEGGGAEKKAAFSIDGPLFMYITSSDRGGDPLSRDAAERGDPRA